MDAWSVAYGSSGLIWWQPVRYFDIFIQILKFWKIKNDYVPFQLVWFDGNPSFADMIHPIRHAMITTELSSRPYRPWALPCKPQPFPELSPPRSPPFLSFHHPQIPSTHHPYSPHPWISHYLQLSWFSIKWNSDQNYRNLVVVVHPQVTSAFLD